MREIFEVPILLFLEIRFEVAKTKKACIIFFDEIDAIGGTRFHDDAGTGDSEVQRTMASIKFYLLLNFNTYKILFSLN